MSRQLSNPYTAWKRAHGYSYDQFADLLGISLSFAKKLGSGATVGVSPSMAERFERRSNGELRFETLMRWAARAEAAA